MSKRITRVNELLRREISEQMRRYYRSDAAAITISEVDTSPDLRSCRIYYSVLGDEAAIAESRALFNKIGKDLHQRVIKTISFKFFPRFEFIYDPSLERGAEILNLLDELDKENG